MKKYNQIIRQFVAMLLVIGAVNGCQEDEHFEEAPIIVKQITVTKGIDNPLFNQQLIDYHFHQNNINPFLMSDVDYLEEETFTNRLDFNNGIEITENEYITQTIPIKTFSNETRNLIISEQLEGTLSFIANYSHSNGENHLRFNTLTGEDFYYIKYDQEGTILSEISLWETTSYSASVSSGGCWAIIWIYPGYIDECGCWAEGEPYPWPISVPCPPTSEIDGSGGGGGDNWDDDDWDDNPIWSPPASGGGTGSGGSSSVPGGINTSPTETTDPPWETPQDCIEGWDCEDDLLIDFDAYDFCMNQYNNPDYCFCNQPSGDCEDMTFEEWEAYQTIINSELNLTIEEIDCMQPQWIEVAAYILAGGDNELVEDFAKIMCEDSGYKIDRFVELDSILTANPWALVEDCIEEEGLDIQDYNYLYNFELPTSTQERLNNYNGFEYQPIEAGNVSLTNVDYYSVELTQLPDVNGNGLQDETTDDVFEAFRVNFGALASGSKDNFDPDCGPSSNIWWEFDYYSQTPPIYTPIPSYYEEKKRWNIEFPYTSPLNTIFLIDAGADPFHADWLADKGSIIISEHIMNSHFIASTISTPESGSQPFSGQRQWGYIINANGNMEIYTKAIDVAHLTGQFRLISLVVGNSCAMNDYYKIAEETWKNLQNKIEVWVEQSGNDGQANTLPFKRVNIKNEKVTEILKQPSSIGNQIDCN